MSMPYNLQDLLSPHHLTPASDPSHPLSSWPSLNPSPLGRTILLLDPTITQRAAASEIKSGKRFSLDYSVYPSGVLLYGRQGATHTFKRVDGGLRDKPSPLEAGKGEKEDGGEKGYQPVYDCFVHLNTQGTTQWDYFLHYSYFGSGLFYGGLTAGQVEREETGDIGVAAIAKAGGVQTRAILLDLPTYFTQKNQPALDPLSFPSSTKIDLPLLKSVLSHFNLTPQVGDVLLIRTGFEETITSDQARVANGEETQLVGRWAGVTASEEVVRWIWEMGFVAVGSDNPTFEEWEPKPPAMVLHPILLSGLGIMIGELLRLKDVAEECQRENRWSFFFSSCPLMVEHGVASPPNAVAIF